MCFGRSVYVRYGVWFMAFEERLKCMVVSTTLAFERVL